MSRCVPLVVLILALTPLGPGAAADAVSVGDQVTSFLYEPPQDFQGDLTLRFVFDWGDANPCSVFFGMSGAVSDAPLWGLVDSDQGESYAFYHDHFVRVHDGDLQVDPSLVQEDPFWSFGIFAFETRSGLEEFLVAGIGLTTWVSKAGGAFQNLYFQVQCEEPFRVVALAGGDQMAAFTELGGAGIGGGVYAPGVELHAAHDDGVSAQVATPLGALVVHIEGGSGVVAGEYHTQTPGGAVAALFTGPVHVRYLGGPGGYGASFTGVAAGTATNVMAAVLELTPVASTDDLATWTG